MEPSISRQTIVDRRQPAIRWSAVIAGTALAVGGWLLLHLIGMGIGLARVDVDAAGELRGVGIGTSVWTLLAPVIAMFAGGMFAGKLAGTYDRKVAGAHGIAVWSLAAVIGIGTMLWLITSVAAGTGHVYATRFTHEDVRTADATGRALCAVGVSLLLGLAAAITGAVLALKEWTRQRPTRHAHVTAPYPPVTPTE